jgi:hypothetical protein
MEFSQIPGFFLFKGLLIFVVLICLVLMFYNFAQRARRRQERERKDLDSAALNSPQSQPGEDKRVLMKQNIEEDMMSQIYYNDI